MSNFNFTVDLSVTENGRKRPEYTLDTDATGEMSLMDFLEYVKAHLIVVSDSVLREEQANGFDRKPVVVVDGRAGKPVSSVSPFGKIEFVSKASMNEILLETYDGILGRSPVLTGLYKSSHYVFLNGKQVATDRPSLEAWLKTNPAFQENDLIRFVNIQPYARKLERLGVTNQRQKSRTVQKKDKRTGETKIRALQPNGTYFLTARAIRAKYKRNSVIKFTFISGGNLGLSGSFKSGRRGRNSSGRAYLYPTIVISVQESGSF